MPNKAIITVDAGDAKRLRDVVKGLKQMGSDPDGLIRGTVLRTVKIAQRNAKRMGAYDSGRLHDNIEVKRIGKGKYEFTSEAIDPDTGADYAPIVHDGLARTGRNSKSRPYLREAIRTLGKRIEYNLRTTFRDLVSLGRYKRPRG